MADQLSETYQDLLTGNYDCVDRIVLNAYFRPGHSGGGFRVWWQKLTGTIDTLDNAHLMRLSGRFSRRVRAWAKGSGIPLIDCSPGERKHDIAEEHLKKTTVKQGVFLILVARAQAPVWDVGPKHRLERKKPMPYVNHYSFHILDPAGATSPSRSAVIRPFQPKLSSMVTNMSRARPGKLEFNSRKRETASRRYPTPLAWRRSQTP